jgi:hypothetical protein
MSGMRNFIDDLDQILDRIRQEKATASANPIQRQRLITRIRRVLRQIGNWEQHISNQPPNQKLPTDDGDLVFLEIMKEDFENELHSLGAQLESSHAPTMRELVSKIAV